MEDNRLQIDKQKLENLRRYAENGEGLVRALSIHAYQQYSYDNVGSVWKELSKIHRKPVEQLTKDDFLCKEMIEAVRTLGGGELAEDFPQIVDLCMAGQYSSSAFRRSYASKNIAFYTGRLERLVSRLIFQSCCQGTTAERMHVVSFSSTEYEFVLAVKIRKGDEEIISLLHEAMMGDNSEILLTRTMIEAIVISGHEGLLDDLEKLILAARFQEGLRQQILEAADKGSAKTLSRFLKICIDEDMFRYSAVIRAFDTWMGMGYGDNKPAAIRKYAQCAYECLTDEAKRQEYLRSDSNTECYFALWAQGCYEMEETIKILPQLLEDERHYRRVLGWMFVSRADSSHYQMKLASMYLHERDPELMAWITRNLVSNWRARQFRWKYRPIQGGVPEPDLPPEKGERRKLFYSLRDMALAIGSKKRTFTGNPFEFVSVSLESEPVYSCMMAAAAYDMDRELINELKSLALNMTVDQREMIINTFLRPDKDEADRAYLRSCLNDKSVMVKETAIERLAACALEHEDMKALAAGLKSKSSSLRAMIMAVFKKQKKELLAGVLPMMLKAKEEYQNQAAIELISELKDEHPDMLSDNRSAIADLQKKKVSTQTQILIDQLFADETEEVVYSAENGYGLYDPAAVSSFAAGLKDTYDGELLTAEQIGALLPTQKDLNEMLNRMGEVFERHADYEYEVEWYDGSRHKVLFGDLQYGMSLPAESGCRALESAGARIEMIPFWEEFKEAIGEFAKDVRKMLGLFCMTTRIYDPMYHDSQLEFSPWYLPIKEMKLTPRAGQEFHFNHKRSHLLIEILNMLFQLFDPHEVFVEAIRLYRSMIAIWGEDRLGEPYYRLKTSERVIIVHGVNRGPIGLNHRMFLIWRTMLHKLDLNKEDFAEWFMFEYRLEQLVKNAVTDPLQTEEFFRAHRDGLIPDDCLTAFLMNKSCMPEKIRWLSNPAKWPAGRAIFEKYPFAQEIMPKVFERIVDVEEKRGELPTELTAHCLALDRFEGAGHFCNILAALGRESFFRGYEYSSNDTKKGTLSMLLKRCYPAKDDTPQKLREMLKKTDISGKRLAEAVMYAPQWAGFAEEVLNWPGLKCGVWFFHAHINESFTAEKETEAAIYSPISPQQFNDGAFDRHWFFEAYDQLGEERFQILYNAAKYITAGSNQHRRSQLYSDAVLGRMDANELMQEITEKRNQEKLRCYPLIPIAEGDEQEALRRYEFIQRFLKESKQFGAQRRESEKKACQTAMENLAITTGLMDVNRLMWQMESRKIDQIRPLMEPVELEGVSVRLEIDEAGDAGIVIEKNGKPVKTLPKPLAKNETYLELKAAAKELKDLKSRSRESLERAMMECIGFGAEELLNICNNPVLAPMILNLVWTDGTNNGFLRQTEKGLALLKLDGEYVSANTLRVAHPHDLREAGEWAEYMRLLYEKQLIQPFKQVFREYYPMTAEERQEKTISRRYAGHQVQPKRTVALLKGRGWTVDYEEGLQKVFYKENLIVRMFAMADWFSPADIEAPTLETVEFFDRKTGKNVPLEDVPPILFSETMRDIDLVVSVAHVGGVDPEASHSTVEMRTAIAGELVRLLKLTNVSWIGSHAKIHGALANYSVHMGSGVVHAEGVGMLMILPVHSQARGRIFLPFADDDPKTAEIMSKILLLAEDQKIKDPSILGQITG